MREEGFYWVRFDKSDDPQVMRWEEGKWWPTGGDVGFDNDDLEVIGERLEPPHTTAPSRRGEHSPA